MSFEKEYDKVPNNDLCTNFRHNAYVYATIYIRNATNGLKPTNWPQKDKKHRRYGPPAYQHTHIHKKSIMKGIVKEIENIDTRQIVQQLFREWKDDIRYNIRSLTEKTGRKSNLTSISSPLFFTFFFVIGKVHPKTSTIMRYETRSVFIVLFLLQHKKGT